MLELEMYVNTRNTLYRNITTQASCVKDIVFEEKFFFITKTLILLAASNLK